MWSISPAVGTISTAGLYTTPASLASSQSVTVKAASAADPSVFATAVVNLVAPIGIIISPTTGSLTTPGATQFTATVTGTANTAVAWSISPDFGTISPTGIYTAPASVTASQVVKVTAVSMANPQRMASANLTVKPPVLVSVAPSTTSLYGSQTQQFTAAVSGASSTGVTWTLTSGPGTMSKTGLYTAPANITAVQTVSVTATSTATPTKSATATITLKPTVTVSVTPGSASLQPSQLQAVTAQVSGSTTTGVTWLLKSPVGTLSMAGNTAVYTAPAIIDAAQTVEVDAVSMADPAQIARAFITLVPAVLISVSPGSVALQPGQMQQFTAAVTGTANPAVTWSVNPAVGTIDPTGLYTAPILLASAQDVTVSARSVSDPTKTASGIASLPATPKLMWSVDANRLTTLSYGGVNYYQYVDYIVQNRLFRSPAGTPINPGWSKPSKATLYSNPTAFEQVYNSGQACQFTLRVTWTQTDSRTLKADVLVTNNDPVNTLITLELHILSFNLPGPANQYNNNIPFEVNQYNGQPAALLSGNWGSVALWQSGYPTAADLRSDYGSATQTSFANILSTTTTSCGPNPCSLEVPPGQSRSMTQYIRFGSSSETAFSLAPDAYAEYRSAIPNLVNWPDRRPIANWMISDGSHRSTKNPRGYLNDQTLDVSDAATFQARVMKAADDTIAVMNGMTVKPQGIVIWDLEGQEFSHVFTYVGYPNQLPGLAPEMDAVADVLMAKLKAAGYRVGVTLRPQQFLTGNALPLTCTAAANAAFSDKFVLLTAPFPYRGYTCMSSNGWGQSGANGPSQQQSLQDYDLVLNLLRQKVSYARNRWGATLFYVDSNVWANGGPVSHWIFRSLAAEFPDCLFMPELNNAAYFGATAPYRAATFDNYWGTTEATRTLYPGGFAVINVADADWQTNFSRLVQAVQGGDILMFRGWWSGAPEIPGVQQIYAAAGVK